MSMFIGGAQAADMEYEQAIQGLVVSGVVDQWVGYSFVSSPRGNTDPVPDSYFTSGTNGRLAIPLGPNFAIQMDGDIEYTDNAFTSNINDVYEFGGQFGTHLSYRDPGFGAFGAFAAFGAGRGEEGTDDFYALGGEFMLYANDLTFYLQGGYLDSSDVRGDQDDDGLHDALFARGVARWFITPQSRLQAEVSYASGKQDSDDKDMDVIEWGVRYDTMLSGLPLIGDTNVFVAYRGANFDNGCCTGGDTGEYTDHTVMIGTRYSFGGQTMREFDRVGATLDLPNFGRWVQGGENVD